MSIARRLKKIINFESQMNKIKLLRIMHELCDFCLIFMAASNRIGSGFAGFHVSCLFRGLFQTRVVLHTQHISSALRAEFCSVLPSQFFVSPSGRLKCISLRAFFKRTCTGRGDNCVFNGYKKCTKNKCKQTQRNRRALVTESETREHPLSLPPSHQHAGRRREH